ncbi:hypothetical protein [Paracoccus pacificus]|uniref:Ca2+-binding protein, RTX toxin-related n=1 Tax=Paracoccus pacificus TaxID=1463598 RepID=A0ABW4R742_9RHOB
MTAFTSASFAFAPNVSAAHKAIINATITDLKDLISSREMPASFAYRGGNIEKPVIEFTTDAAYYTSITGNVIDRPLIGQTAERVPGKFVIYYNPDALTDSAGTERIYSGSVVTHELMHTLYRGIGGTDVHLTEFYVVLSEINANLGNYGHPSEDINIIINDSPSNVLASALLKSIASPQDSRNFGLSQGQLDRLVAAYNDNPIYYPHNIDVIAKLSSFLNKPISTYIVQHDNCFSAHTEVLTAGGTQYQISAVRAGDLILSFDASGCLVPGRVTQLLHSVTDTWLHLSNGTYVTPGHRYLRPDGSFAEIRDIVADDGRIVAADGSVQTVTAEVIRYSAETAHMFEEAEMLVYASEGGTALAPEVKRGWKTYNFTVAETHTYIADGIRVHNESVLLASKDSDSLLSVDGPMQNAAVLRDVNGDGRDEVVILDGVREPGRNTVVVQEYTYTAPSSIANVAAAVQNKMAAIDGAIYTVNGQTFTVNIYGNPFDPGNGNGYNDGRVSDDVDEMLCNDMGFGRALTAQNKLYLKTGLTAADVSQSVIGGILYLTITQADGTRVTENIGTASQISSINFSNGSSVGYGALAAQINGTSGADNLTGTSGADAMDGFGGNDTLNGAGGNDRLYGGVGDDFLFGGAGADRLDGGAGTDWARYNLAAAAVIADMVSPGNNTGEAAGDIYVGIENLFGSNYNDILRGDAGANVLAGGGGNDRLEGAYGNDTLNAGTGSDTMLGGMGDDVYVTDGGDTLTEAVNAGTDQVNSSAFHVLAANFENLVLTGAAAINGVGNALANRITGNAAANVLDGGGGSDTLVGGDGDDGYVTDGGDTITEAANAGTDRVLSSVSYTLGPNLEDLILTGTAAINGTGNELANRITGNAAANVLNGGAGQDSMTGGDGNDVYITEGLDTISETANAGTDRVQSSGSFTLSANLENLTLTGSAVSGTGNDLDNVIIGNAANNGLLGGAGNDTLNGGLGNDTIDGSTGADTIVFDDAAWVGVDLVNGVATGGQGGDTLRNITHIQTGSGNDNLIGNNSGNNLNAGAGNDTISGWGGADRIIGGAGTDLMRGGAGDAVTDTFVFGAVTDSATGTAKDVVEDFVSGIDSIDLNPIDANTTAAGNQAFLFNGTTARAYAVWYVGTADGIVVRADVDGNITADFEVLLKNITNVTAADFIL